MNTLAAAVPDPGPTAPPGFEELAGNLLGWLKWGVLVAGVLGILICALMLIIGRRNRSATALRGPGRVRVGDRWVGAGVGGRAAGRGVPDMNARPVLALSTVAALAVAVGCAAPPPAADYAPDAVAWVAVPDNGPAPLVTVVCGPEDAAGRSR